jgi:nucleoside phosphorylase
MTLISRDPLFGRWFIVAGSASPISSPELLERSHAFVREVVRQAWKRGAGFVVIAGNEPQRVDEPKYPLVFDWTVLEEIRQLVADTNNGRLSAVAITAPKFMTSGMPEERRALLQVLSAQGIVRVEGIADNLWVGGRFREEQASRADAMICLGGGKGVADLAQRLLTRGAPVLPMDIELRGINEDGGGARELYRDLTQYPSRFLHHTGAQVPSQLFELSLGNESMTVQHIAATAVEVISQELRAMDAAAQVNVLMVTALPVELAAARDALGLHEDPPEKRGHSGTNIWRGALSSASSGESLVVGLCCLGLAGNIGAAAVVSELVAELSPRLVVMVGIAAGMRGKRRLGEVVINEEIITYEPAARIQIGDAHGVQARPRTWRTPHATAQYVVSYLSQPLSIERRVAEILLARGFAFPTPAHADDAVCAPAVYFATIASGEKLIRDSIVWDELRSLHGKIDVAEMEAAGVAQACDQHEVPFLVFRGISDFGDINKNDSYHQVASVVAAEVAVDFLRHGISFNR